MLLWKQRFRSRSHTANCRSRNAISIHFCIFFSVTSKAAVSHHYEKVERLRWDTSLKSPTIYSQNVHESNHHYRTILTMATNTYWNDSIKLNNIGVQKLIRGQTTEALGCFQKASQLNEEASYDLPIDGYGTYAGEWISLSLSLNHPPTISAGKTTHTLQPLQTSALAIGDRILVVPNNASSSYNDIEGHRSAVCVSRIDWIVDFNLATALQLYAMASSKCDPASSRGCLQKSFEIYRQVADDILEWNDYATTIDLAMFLMAIYRNQGEICGHLGEQKMEFLCRLRLDRIRQSCCAHSGVNRQLQVSENTAAVPPPLPLSCKDNCAPVA